MISPAPLKIFFLVGFHSVLSFELKNRGVPKQPNLGLNSVNKALTYYLKKRGDL